MLTTRKAAEALDVSTKTIRRMIARGDLPGAVKLGGPGVGRKEWRIPTEAINQHLGRQ